MIGILFWLRVTCVPNSIGCFGIHSLGSIHHDLLTCLGWSLDRVYVQQVMTTQVKLWTMEGDFGVPTFYSRLELLEDETYTWLRVCLEEKATLEWPLSCRTIRSAVE